MSTDLFTHGAFLLPSCFHSNQTLCFFVTEQSHPMANTTTSNATTTIQCCNVVKVALVASAWIQEISRTDVSLPSIEQKKIQSYILWTVTSCIVSDTVSDPLYSVLVMNTAQWQAYSIDIWEYLVDLYCVILW